MTAPSPEKVVFAVSFEAMFVRALGKPLPAALQKALLELQVDIDRLHVAYPLQTWKDALAAARRCIHPELSDADAHAQLGNLFIRSYFDTLIGRAIKPLLRAIGTRRSLERMRQNFRGGNDFSDSTLEKLGERKYLFRINDDLGHPSFVLGIIQEGIRLAVDPSFQMTLLDVQPPEATFECSWG